MLMGVLKLNDTILTLFSELKCYISRTKVSKLKVDVSFDINQPKTFAPDRLLRG